MPKYEGQSLTINDLCQIKDGRMGEGYIQET